MEPGRCPCGDEPLTDYGLHLLGEECSSRVVRCVRGFFGASSGLATSEELQDTLQECLPAARETRPASPLRGSTGPSSGGCVPWVAPHGSETDLPR